MGWLYRKLREFEWIVSLWSMVSASGWFLLVIGLVLAMLSAIGTIAYDSAAWINSYGRSGWILATVAAVIVVCVLVVSLAAAWRVVRGFRLKPSLSASERTAERHNATGELLSRIDRSIFLLLVNATVEGTHRDLWKAFNSLPPKQEGQDDDSLLRIAQTYQYHVSDTGMRLTPTHWRVEFDRVMDETAYRADIELRTADLPAQFKPMIYREYFIADRKRDALESFLRTAIAESDGQRDDTLRMLRDQKAFQDRN